MELYRKVAWEQTRHKTACCVFILRKETRHQRSVKMIFIAYLRLFGEWKREWINIWSVLGKLVVNQRTVDATVSEKVNGDLVESHRWQQRWEEEVRANGLFAGRGERLERTSCLRVWSCRCRAMISGVFRNTPLRCVQFYAIANKIRPEQFSG